MDSEELRRLQELDAEIGSIEKTVGDLFVHMKCEKAGEKKGNPTYKYLSTNDYEKNPFDIGEYMKKLEGMKIDGDTEYHKILEVRRDASIKKLNVIAARGIDYEITWKCVDYYKNALPNKKELEKAKEVLQQERTTLKEVENLNAYDLKRRMESTLQNKDIEWKVVIAHPKPDEKISKLTLHKHRKEVVIRDDYKGSERAVKKSNLHEVEGHIFQWENGLLQPLPQTFFYGLDGRSVKTYEGLTKVLEKKGGVLGDLHKSAAYVVAVNSSLIGASYMEIISILGEYNLLDEEKKDIAHRVKRGLTDTSKPGGFPKDAVYFTGMLQVENYLEGGGSIEDLYMGCVCVEQMPMIKRLLVEGKLNPPKFLPEI